MAKIASALAVVLVCVMVLFADAHRELQTTPPCNTGSVGRYKHCGTDRSGKFGACKSGYICAFGNEWWSMCVTPSECPKQKGYQCNRDACGNELPPKPVEGCPGASVAQWQHCGMDSAGSFGVCKDGMICAYLNEFWSMCLTKDECPKQGGYKCNRDCTGKVV